MFWSHLLLGLGLEYFCPHFLWYDSCWGFFLSNFSRLLSDMRLDLKAKLWALLVRSSRLVLFLAFLEIFEYCVILGSQGKHKLETYKLSMLPKCI